MSYSLIGIRPNHDQMKQMIGESLLTYRVTAVESERVNIEIAKTSILGIRIGKDDKWEFIFDRENLFNPEEPIFVSEKSLKRFVRQAYKGRVVYKEWEEWK